MKFKLLNIKKTVAVATSLCFLFTMVFSQTVSATLTPAPVPAINQKTFKSIEDYLLPFSIGRITDALYTGGDEIVINIQDLHSHAQAQRNISNILAILDKKYDLENVYVEGGIGQVDTSWLSSITDEKLKETILNNMLESGRLTGGEYYSVETNKNKLLLGIEDKATYINNLKRLNEFYSKKQEILKYVSFLKYTLNEISKKYYSTDNLKLNRVVLKHKEGNLSAEKYFTYLIKTAQNANVNLRKYPNVVFFLNVLKKQDGLDTKKVNLAIAELLNDLKAQLSYDQYQTLLSKVSDKKKETEFYFDLYKIAKEKGLLEKSNYRTLLFFFEYLSLNQSLNPVNLTLDEKNLLQELNIKLSKNQNEKDIYFLQNYMEYFSGYLTNKLTADEYEYFINNMAKFRLLWKKYVDINGIIELDSYFNFFSDFYKDNVERNKYFIKNIMGKMPDNPKEGIRIKANIAHAQKVLDQLSKTKKVKVVITGGFHTYGFTKLLQDNNVSYIVITPNVSKQNVQADVLYENIFKEQSSALYNTLQKMLASQIGEDGILNSDVVEALASAKLTAQAISILNKALADNRQNIKVTNLQFEDGNNKAIVYLNNGDKKEIILKSEEQQTEKEKEISAQLDKQNKSDYITFNKIANISKEIRELNRQISLEGANKEKILKDIQAKITILGEEIEKIKKLGETSPLEEYANQFDNMDKIFSKENVVFIGPSGSGKSTTVNLVAETTNAEIISFDDLIKEYLTNPSKEGEKLKEGSAEYNKRFAEIKNGSGTEIAELLDRKIKQSVSNNRIFVDGFGRTAEQIDTLKKIIGTVNTVFVYMEREGENALEVGRQKQIEAGHIEGSLSLEEEREHWNANREDVLGKLKEDGIEFVHITKDNIIPSSVIASFAVQQQSQSEKTLTDDERMVKKYSKEGITEEQTAKFDKDIKLINKFIDNPDNLTSDEESYFQNEINKAKNVVKFGTAGHREKIVETVDGKVVEKFNPFVVFVLTDAYAQYINNNESLPRRMFVGYDTRYMGKEYAYITAKTFAKYGIEVDMPNGYLSTPAISNWVKNSGIKYAGSVNITASHNPGNYNGYKVNGQLGDPYGSIVTDEISKIAKAEKEYDGRFEISAIKTRMAQSKQGKINEQDVNKFRKAHVNNAMTIIQNMLGKKDVSLLPGTKIIFDANHSALEFEVKSIFNRLTEKIKNSIYKVLNSGRDVIFGKEGKDAGKSPEPNENNSQQLKDDLQKTVDEQAKGTLSKEKIKQIELTNFAVTTDPDGDRFGMYYVEYNEQKNKFEVKFATPDEMGAVVQLILLENLKSRMMSELKKGDNYKDWLNKNGFPIGLVKSADTTDQFNNLAKVYEQEFIEIISGKTGVSKNEVEKNVKIEVATVDIGYKNLSDAAQEMIKKGINPIILLESSGGLVAGLSQNTGTFDKDGLVANMLPIVLLQNENLTFAEALQKIGAVTEKQESLGRTKVEKETEGLIELSKKLTFKNINTGKNIPADDDIDVVDAALMEIGNIIINKSAAGEYKNIDFSKNVNLSKFISKKDIEKIKDEKIKSQINKLLKADIYINPDTSIVNGFEIRFYNKSGYSLIVRASGTEPAIRIYTKTMTPSVEEFVDNLSFGKEGININDLAAFFEKRHSSSIYVSPEINAIANEIVYKNKKYENVKNYDMWNDGIGEPENLTPEDKACIKFLLSNFSKFIEDYNYKGNREDLFNKYLLSIQKQIKGKLELTTIEDNEGNDLFHFNVNKNLIDDEGFNQLKEDNPNVVKNPFEDLSQDKIREINNIVKDKNINGKITIFYDNNSISNIADAQAFLSLSGDINNIEFVTETENKDNVINAKDYSAEEILVMAMLSIMTETEARELIEYISDLKNNPDFENSVYQALYASEVSGTNIEKFNVYFPGADGLRNYLFKTFPNRNPVVTEGPQLQHSIGQSQMAARKSFVTYEKSEYSSKQYNQYSLPWYITPMESETATIIGHGHFKTYSVNKNNHAIGIYPVKRNAQVAAAMMTLFNSVGQAQKEKTKTERTKDEIEKHVEKNAYAKAIYKSIESIKDNDNKLEYKDKKGNKFTYINSGLKNPKEVVKNVKKVKGHHFKISDNLTLNSLEDFYKALYGGEYVNNGESYKEGKDGRPANHHVLENIGFKDGNFIKIENNKLTFEQKTMLEEHVETLNRMLKLLKEWDDQKIETIIFNGIGGSELGPRMIVEFLELADFKNIKNIRFISSPSDINNVKKDLDPATTAIVGMSKSGTTLETKTNMRNLLEWKFDGVDQKNEEDIAKAVYQVAYVSDKPYQIKLSLCIALGIGEEQDIESIEKEIDEKEKTNEKILDNFLSKKGVDFGDDNDSDDNAYINTNKFGFDDSIGGRWSWISAIGMAVVAYNPKTFFDIVEGARGVTEKENDNFNDISTAMAATSIKRTEIDGEEIQYIKFTIAGENKVVSLPQFVEWYKQLLEESNGKGEDIEEKLLDKVSSCESVEFNDGSIKKSAVDFNIVICPEGKAKDHIIENAEENLICEYTNEDNIPSIFGEVLNFFEKKVEAEGFMRGVNSYHQPAVQDAKTASADLDKQVKNGRNEDPNDKMQDKIIKQYNPSAQLDLGFAWSAPVIESPMLFISLFVPAFRKNFINMHNYSYENNIKGAYKDFFTRKTTNGTERDKKADIQEIEYGVNFVSIFTFASSLFITSLVGIVLGNCALHNLINYILLFVGLSYPLSIAFHHIWNSFMDFLGTPESKLDLSLGDKISKFFKDVYEKRIVVDQVPDPIVTEYIIKNKNKDTDTFANEEEAIYRKLKNAQQRLEQIKTRLEAIDRVKAKVPASAKTFDNDEDVSLLNKEKDELEKEIIPSLEEELNKIQNAQLDLGLFGNMFKNRSTLRAIFAGVAESLILVPVTVVDTIQKILTGNFNNAEYVGKAGQWFLNKHPKYVLADTLLKQNPNNIAAKQIKETMEQGLNDIERTTSGIGIASVIATVLVFAPFSNGVLNGFGIIGLGAVAPTFAANMIKHFWHNLNNPEASLDLGQSNAKSDARYMNYILEEQSAIIGLEEEYIGTIRYDDLRTLADYTYTDLDEMSVEQIQSYKKIIEEIDTEDIKAISDGPRRGIFELAERTKAGILNDIKIKIEEIVTSKGAGTEGLQQEDYLEEFKNKGYVDSEGRGVMKAISDVYDYMTSLPEYKGPEIRKQVYGGTYGKYENFKDHKHLQKLYVLTHEHPAKLSLFPKEDTAKDAEEALSKYTGSTRSGRGTNLKGLRDYKLIIESINPADYKGMEKEVEIVKNYRLLQADLKIKKEEESEIRWNVYKYMTSLPEYKGPEIRKQVYGGTYGKYENFKDHKHLQKLYVLTREDPERLSLLPAKDAAKDAEEALSRYTGFTRSGRGTNLKGLRDYKLIIKSINPADYKGMEKEVEIVKNYRLLQTDLEIMKEVRLHDISVGGSLDLGLFSNIFAEKRTLRAIFAGVAESLILVPVTVVDTIQKALTGNLNNDEYIGYAGQLFLNAHGARYKNNLNKKAMEIGLNRVEKATAISTVAAAVVTMFVAISLFLGSGDVAAHNLVNGLDIPSTISLTDAFKYIIFALFGSNILSHSVFNIFKPGAKLDLSLGDRIKKALENMWRNHAFDFGHFAGGIEVADAIRNQLESDDYSIKIKTTFNNIEKYIENIEKDTNAERKGLDDLKKLISIKSNILDMYAATETTNFFKQIYDLTENNKTENDNVLFNYEWTTVILSGEYEQIIDNLNNLNLPEIKDDVDTLYNSLANVEESGFMAISRAIELYNEATNDTDRKFVLDALKNMQEAIENRIKDIEEGKQKVDDKKLEDLEQYLAEIKNITESETDVRFTKDSTKENRFVRSLDNYINDETNNRVLRFGASFVRELVVSTLEFKAVFDEDFLQKHSQYRKAKDAGDKETAETMEKGVKYIKYGSFGILLVSSVLSCLYIGVDAGSVHNLFNLMASMVIGIVSGVLSSIGIHAGYNLFNRNAKLTKDYDELHDLLYSMDIFGEDGQTIGLTEVALNKLKEFNKYNDSNFKDFSDMASQLKEFVAGEQNIQNANKVVKIFKNLANSEIDELTTLNFIYGFVQFEKIKKLVDIYNDENASYVEREKARRELEQIKDSFGQIDVEKVRAGVNKFSKQLNLSQDGKILNYHANYDYDNPLKSTKNILNDNLVLIKEKIEDFYDNSSKYDNDYKNFIENIVIPIYIENEIGEFVVNYRDIGPSIIMPNNVKVGEYYDKVAKIDDYSEYSIEELTIMLEIVDRAISFVNQKKIVNLPVYRKKTRDEVYKEKRTKIRQELETRAFEFNKQMMLDEVSKTIEEIEKENKEKSKDKKNKFESIKKNVKNATTQDELDNILVDIAGLDQQITERLISRFDVKKSLIDIDGENLAGKTIGLVVDLNAPLDSSKTKVTDPTRIEATLRTIKYLTDRGANVVLMSHLGRPTDEKNIEKRYKDFNMEPVAKKFREFGIDVDFEKASSKETYSEYINRVNLSINEKTQGKVFLLDNLRFDERYSDKETKSQMADQFINKLELNGVVFDAFGVSHRNNFSADMMTELKDRDNKENEKGIKPEDKKYVGSVTGFLVEKELNEFAKIENPKHPMVAILGGSKVSDKIGVINNLLDKMQKGDTIVIGGAMAYTFLFEQGYKIGNSKIQYLEDENGNEILDENGNKIIDPEPLRLAREVLNNEKVKNKEVRILLPIDHVVSTDVDFKNQKVPENAIVKNTDKDKDEANIEDGFMGVDIGKDTVREIQKVLENVGKNNGTIVWNGPSGIFEIDKFAQGTFAVARAVADASDRENGAFSMIGGGDSVAAANKAGVADRISHISTGGGASLNLLEGNSSPLIEVIPSKYQEQIDILKSGSKASQEQVSTKDSDKKEPKKTEAEVQPTTEKEEQSADEIVLIKNKIDALDVKFFKSEKEAKEKKTEYKKVVDELAKVNQLGLLEGYDGESLKELLESFAEVETGVKEENGKVVPRSLSEYFEDFNRIATEEEVTPKLESASDVTTNIQSMNDDKFKSLSDKGISEISKLGVVLVAGGMGERLGYFGIKIGLKFSSLFNRTYIGSYINYFDGLAEEYEQRTGKTTEIPLTIMVSDSTHDKTVDLLNKMGYKKDDKQSDETVELEVYTMPNKESGVRSVYIMTQKNVPAVKDGRFSIADGKLETKPHGHGDVHLKMHTTGMAAKYNEMEKSRTLFIQDTNGSGMNFVLPSLGSMAENKKKLSIAGIYREDGEAVGALGKVKKGDNSFVGNVEYNILGDKKGYHSGNINQYILDTDEYEEILKTATMPEMTNPKPGKAARLETLMQDIFESFDPKDTEIINFVDKSTGFSPAKNGIAVIDTDDNGNKVVKFADKLSDTMITAEMDNYDAARKMLESTGNVEFTGDKKDIEIAGMSLKEKTGRQIGAFVFLDKYGTPRGLSERIKGKNEITQNSSVYFNGQVGLENTTIDGAINIIAGDNVSVTVKGNIKNDGYEIEPLSTEEMEEILIRRANQQNYDESDAEDLQNAIRGYKYNKKQEFNLNIGEEGDYEVIGEENGIVTVYKIAENGQRTEYQKYQLNAEGEYEKQTSSSKVVDAATAQTTGTVKTLNDLLQRLAVNAYSLFKEKPEIVAIVDVNDNAAIKEAKQLAEQGIKIKLIVVGNADEIKNNELLSELNPTQETEHIAGDTDATVSFELEAKDGKLTVISYEAVNNDRVDSNTIVNEQLRENKDSKKKVLYVSSKLIEQSENETALNSAVIDDTILTYSNSSIAEAVAQGVVAYKNKDKALNTVVSSDSMIASYDVNEEIDYEAERAALNNQKISRVMIKIKNDNDIEKAKAKEKVEKFNENGIADVIVVLDKDNTYEVKSENEDSKVVSYDNARDMLNKKEDIKGIIVYIGSQEQNNLILTVDDMGMLIDKGAVLAFDSDIVNYMDSEKTTENGVSLLNIIKSIFEQSSPEAKKNRAIEKGRSIVKNNNLGSIKEEDLIKDGKIIVSDKLLSLLEQLKIKVVTREEQELVALGIIQALELQKIDADLLENLNGRSDLDNELLTMLGEYKKSSNGVSFADIYKDVTVESKDGESLNDTLNRLRKKAKEDGDTAAISGVIKILLEDRLDIANDIENLTDNMDIKSISALLSAA